MQKHWQTSGRFSRASPVPIHTRSAVAWRVCLVYSSFDRRFLCRSRGSWEKFTSWQRNRVNPNSVPYSRIQRLRGLTSIGPCMDASARFLLHLGLNWHFVSAWTFQISWLVQPIRMTNKQTHTQTASRTDSQTHRVPKRQTDTQSRTRTEKRADSEDEIEEDRVYPCVSLSLREKKKWRWRVKENVRNTDRYKGNRPTRNVDRQTFRLIDIFDY